MKIELYGYTTSPYVRKVACYLYYKNLDFNFVPVSPVMAEETLAFTGGKQVPVLKIGEEWRLDSSKIGAWLDELYPEKPLFGSNDAEKAIATKIDDWVSEQFIPGMVFRDVVDGKNDEGFRKRAHRLAEIVSSGATLPDPVREAWPDLIRAAPFIVHMVENLDRSEPLEAMKMRIFMELVAHLGDGPYLGGMSEPTLADFAIFPQVIFPYHVGLVDHMPMFEHPTLGPWLKRVAVHLPTNPWCVDEDIIVNPWPAQ
ncbi:MAG: hypothetical protein COB37_08715 [Kordiimonadales bacterium]|nr:MAG: hypothetical protein COB37_08715 [Kordiimonadales bacterium]